MIDRLFTPPASGRPTLLMALLCLLMTTAAAADPGGASVDTLITVNDEAITTSDLDAMIMTAHERGRMAAMDNRKLQKLFDKALNDRLLLQEARAIGLEDEPHVRVPLAEARAQDARAAFVREHFAPDNSVSAAEVQADFDRYYWKILVRQLSVRTRERADSLRTAILDGAPMDSLALALSLDTHRLRGGAHRLKYWADVENEIRDAVADLEAGELSAPFAYREAFAIARVEERHPVDREAFVRFEDDIRSHLAALKRQAAWRAFVADLEQRTPVTADTAILAEVDADRDRLFTGDFLAGSERPVLSAGDHHRSEQQVRNAISHAAMNDGTAPYDSVRNRGLQAQREQLVLDHAAAAAGYLDDPGVVERHLARRDQALIEAYLGEFISPQIVLDRQEYQAVYDENQDAFRRPDSVKLATMIFKAEVEARRAAERLQGGANFDFVATSYRDADEVTVSKGDWASEKVFSAAIIEQLAEMAVGGTSDPVEIPAGWLVFQLTGRRRGEVVPIEEVDLQIRQVLFQRQFDALLDTHLDLLRERSHIVRHDEAIEKYFGGGN